MKMELYHSSDNSELKNMKSQLSQFGLHEENLSIEEMSDLLKALNNSKSTLKDEKQSQEVNKSKPAFPTKLKRKVLNVKERRMPWSLFPTTITRTEKARTLAVYIKLMSINTHRKARMSPDFMAWPQPIQILGETSRIQPLRSTRSGRSAPVYAGLDDDSSDLDFVVTKTKKRKNSSSEHNAKDGVLNKTFSLKRKSAKDDNSKPFKEQKLSSGNDTADCIVTSQSAKSIDPVED